MESLVLIVLDLDQFKFYNDSFGHPSGDDALRTVASILKAKVAEGIKFYRLGGDEFAILSRKPAVGLAEDLRMAIDTHPWARRPITASFGVASFPKVAMSDLIEEADQALYWAKRAGGNRVVETSQGECMAG